MSNAFDNKYRPNSNVIIHEMADRARQKRKADRLDSSNEYWIKILEKAAASEDRCPGVSRSIIYAKLFSATDEFLSIKR